MKRLWIITIMLVYLSALTFAAVVPELALKQAADNFFNSRNYYQAAYYYGRILDEYPGSSLEAEARRKKDVCNAKRGEIAASKVENAGLKGYEQARRYAYKDKYDQAINLLQWVIAKYPTTDIMPKALYYLGYYCEIFGAADDAIKYYMRLFETHPESPLVDNALYRAGRLYYQRGNVDYAKRVFSQALTVHSGDASSSCLYWWGKLTEPRSMPEALSIYSFTAERFDHTFSAYRAQDRISQLGHDVQIRADFGMQSASLDNKLSEAQRFFEAGNFKEAVKLVEERASGAIFSGTAQDEPKLLWEMTYPKAFWEHVKHYSKLNGLDPYLALAVMREESRFYPKATSRSKARGLMQIIPSTGRILCKANNLSYGPSKLYDAETNIRLGTYYLANLIRRFDGNYAFALAGYNGGPVRVQKWVKTFYNGDDDDFIINIPIRETREYVQKVLGSFYEYRRLYGPAY